MLKPVEEIGQYGGTWRRAWLGVSDRWGPGKILAESITELNWNGTKVIPNLGTSWEASEGGKVFTVHLREGVKWSDGEPFTADDIMFHYEDIILNKELTPNFPKWLIVGGDRGTIEKVDDYTVRFRFSQPYGLFSINLTLNGRYGLYSPKHYAKQFHPRYVS